jgi:hypothetical protein
VGVTAAAAAVVRAKQANKVKILLVVMVDQVLLHLLQVHQ